MSYDIYIGNAEVEYQESVNDFELDEYRYEVRVSVKRIELDNAPIFENDEMTGNGNSRHPGYVQWSTALEHAGILDLFFNDDTGLMRKHPGCFPIVKSDVDAVKSALEQYKKLYPDATPRFGTWENPGKAEDAVLARLEWLVFWMDWAVNNCERPAITNS